MHNVGRVLKCHHLHQLYYAVLILIFLIRKRTSMGNKRYRKRVNRLFQGEVFGEAAYSMAARCTRCPERQYKWETLRKLETQTKRELQGVLFQNGWETAERTRYKLLGNAVGIFAAILPWRLSLKFLEVIIDTGLKTLARFVYKAPQDDKRFAKSILNHERAQYEFVQRELQGDEHSSLEQVLVLLKS